MLMLVQPSVLRDFITMSVKETLGRQNRGEDIHAKNKIRMTGKKRDDDVGVGHLKVSTGTEGGVMLSIHMHSSSRKQQEKKYRVKNIKSRVLREPKREPKGEPKVRINERSNIVYFHFSLFFSVVVSPETTREKPYVVNTEHFVNSSFSEFREYTLERKA